MNRFNNKCDKAGGKPNNNFIQAPSFMLTNSKQDSTSKPKKKSKAAKNCSPQVQKVSSSDTGLGFLQAGQDEDLYSRTIRYSEGAGTSFAVHLLRKSIPMVSQRLNDKLKFKRDSDAGAILEQARKLTKPELLDELDSEELTKQIPGSCLPPFKKNMFNNQILTKRKITEGLQFLKRTNTPHQRPPSPLDDPPKKEIRDPCGRRTHDRKLKARDFCKRLCEAPSMTKELDDLFFEYIKRCSADPNNDACRGLHHAPAGSFRQTRRSILRDDHELRVHRTSSKGHVQFDKTIEIISTMTKVNGMEASLRETGRLRLLQQLKRRNKGTSVPEEKYPLHARDPKKMPVRGVHVHHNLELKGASDDEDMEDKRAKLDLARIYFTTEAARLIACAKLGALDTYPLKREVVRRNSIPHFFIDRLEKDLENEKMRKRSEYLSSIQNEMDSYDSSLKSIQDPEFHFEPPKHVIEQYKQSAREEVLKLQKHNEQIEKLQDIVAKFTTQEVATDYLEVVLDVVDKIGRYREQTGQNPSERLYQQWKATGLAALSEKDANDKMLYCSKPRTSQVGTAGAAIFLNELQINDCSLR